MFNLFNTKPKLNTSVLIWLAIAAFFVIIGVTLLTQVPTVQASSHGLSSIFEGDIVPCGVGKGPLDCQYCHLQILAQNIILWLVGFSVFVAILMFVFAGFLLVTAGANEGQLSQGKKIFWSVFIGLFVVLAAWLIVDLLMSTFLNKDFGPWNKIECAVGTSVTGGATGSATSGLVATPPKFCYA